CREAFSQVLGASPMHMIKGLDCLLYSRDDPTKYRGCSDAFQALRHSVDSWGTPVSETLPGLPSKFPVSLPSSSIVPIKMEATLSRLLPDSIPADFDELMAMTVPALIE
ncbi:MAG: hypothetical protein CYPHOPRED_003963, partial [Cyphobasidiales sp. Tagirdzhanova-0007]